MRRRMWTPLLVTVSLLSLGAWSRVELLATIREKPCRLGYSIFLPKSCFRCYRHALFGNSLMEGTAKTDANGNTYCSTRYNPIRAARPVGINEAVPSPLAQATEYQFATYPFGSSGAAQSIGTLPGRDPISIDRRDPSGGNENFTPETAVDAADNSVLAPLRMLGTNGAAVGTISWPPTSLFANLGIWNKNFAYSFRRVDANHVRGRWYPLNVFSVPDPTAQIPLMPVRIDWAAIPGAAKYRFTLKVDAVLEGTDPNLAAPLSLDRNAAIRSYEFQGRALAVYAWSATPLTIAGAELTGGVITDQGGPFWAKTATAQDIAQLNVGSANYAQSIGIVAGRTYLVGRDMSLFGRLFAPPGGVPQSNAPKEYLQWDAIPGAVRYELQYAFAPLASTLPFTDNLTFTATVPNPQIGGSSTTNHVARTLTVTADAEPAIPGFQYRFTTIPRGHTNGGDGTDPSGSPSGVYWRVRGLDSSGVAIEQSLTQRGRVSPPPPLTPYQSAFVSWPQVPGATAYIVDVVENEADFAALPKLDPSEVQLTEGGSAASARAGSGTVGGPMSAGGGRGPAPAATPRFLLRRVVAPSASDRATVTVEFFKRQLKLERVFRGDVNESFGLYDEGSDVGPNYEETFSDEADAATQGGKHYPPNVLNDYYPLLLADLNPTAGLDLSAVVKSRVEKPSLQPGQLEITSFFPISVVDRSTGGARITVAQSNARRTTVLTFTTRPGVPETGDYAFEITKQPGGGVSIGGNTVRYRLTYNTVGPLPLLPVMTGRHFTRFDRLRPGTTYSWRVRGMSEAGGPMGFAFKPWSAPATFATPTGLPAVVQSGSATEYLGFRYQREGVSDERIPRVNRAQSERLVRPATPAVRRP